MGVPEGYGQLPDGVRCRCIHLWKSDVTGSYWCCRKGDGAEEPPYLVPMGGVPENRIPHNIIGVAPSGDLVEVVGPTQDELLDAMITDDVVMAALRGWCGAPRDHVFSNYQQAPETKAAWRKAIKAALVELGIWK